MQFQQPRKQGARAVQPLVYSELFCPGSAAAAFNAYNTLSSEKPTDSPCQSALPIPSHPTPYHAIPFHPILPLHPSIRLVVRPSVHAPIFVPRLPHRPSDRTLYPSQLLVPSLHLSLSLPPRSSFQSPRAPPVYIVIHLTWQSSCLPSPLSPPPVAQRKGGGRG